MKLDFNARKKYIENQFCNIEWIEESGLGAEELEREVEALEGSCGSKALIKAGTLDIIAEKSRIAIDREDIFQDKLFGGNILTRQRGRWEKAVKDKYLSDESRMAAEAYADGIGSAAGDYGHVSPNSRRYGARRWAAPETAV